DWVIALDVIEHVAELNLCLRECRRVLRTGGSLVVVTPNFLGLGLYDSLADPTHVHRFTWWSLERALRRNGFELTDKMQLLLHSFIPFSDRFPGFLRVLQQSICVVSRRSI
ncbi:MAG: methyltransferase domain-containing protein, partial [Aigarchaeota archaeon]|nr:methyltransferase domain-containing protein [Aigarchaeota archaeon]